MTIAPAAVEAALRSWGDERLARVFEDTGCEGPHIDKALASLARHVAAVLSTQPVRFEVTSPIDQLQAVSRMFEAEGEAQKRRLAECGVREFDIPDLTAGFNGA